MDKPDSEVANGRGAGRSPTRIVLPPWTFDVASGKLNSASKSHNLDLKTAQVLVLLAQRAGQVVSREDIITEVWQGRYVTDNALNRCINGLRRCLGDTGSERLHRDLP